LAYEPETRLMLEAAREAGALLLRSFRQQIQVREKGWLDLVTEADLASESLIRKRIRDVFPEDAITAEESGSEGSGSRHWYVDPLDGTVNYAHGIPIFAVCIAFVDENRLRAGVVFNPAAGDCYTAAGASGAFLNGLPIHGSHATAPADSHVYLNAHGLRESHADRLLAVYGRLGRNVQGVLNLGSMSLALCGVAAGRLDAAIGLDVDAYSTPASALIMAEAGVRVTDLNGEPYSPGAATILAANPVLHDCLLPLLNRALSDGKSEKPECDGVGDRLS